MLQLVANAAQDEGGAAAQVAETLLQPLAEFTPTSAKAAAPVPTEPAT